MTKKYKILIPDRLVPPADIEESVFGDEAELQLFQAVNAHEIEDKVWEECDAVLAWHELYFDKNLLSKMENCKVIVRVGVGYDNIDIVSAAEFGIIVCNVPDYGTDDVADHTMALMLSLCRGIKFYDVAAKEGIWKWEPGSKLRRVKGSTLGIIGLGRIGTAVALRAKAFGLNVRFYDPYKSHGYEKALSLGRDYSLSQLAENSDIISIHTPLTNETKMMIGKDFFESCKNEIIFINTARGQIVNLNSLYEAMKEGKVLFAGLDVLETEPPQFDNPFIKEWSGDKGALKDRVIITPHSAFYNKESYIEMRKKAAEEALRILKGEKPFYEVKK
ncbi:MAG: C-terminal binding protein [Melioribacteraceae bacterium]|nr:C-terminal binding protein [Melioribacteraceae bacterium]